MSDIQHSPKQILPIFVIPTGAARFFLSRRIMARRAAERRDLSSCLMLKPLPIALREGTVGDGVTPSPRAFL